MEEDASKMLTPSLNEESLDKVLKMIKIKKNNGDHEGWVLIVELDETSFASEEINWQIHYIDKSIGNTCLSRFWLDPLLPMKANRIASAYLWYTVEFSV